MFSTVGFAKQALHRREGRPDAGLAALALDRGHQSGLLAADERAGAQADVDVKIKAGVKDVLAQQAVLTGLLDGNLQALDRNGVLGTDVDVALVGADGVAGDGHGLQHAVGVALQHGAVHERAGVALVGVAADILLVGVVSARQTATCGRWGSRRRRGRAGRRPASGR